MRDCAKVYYLDACALLKYYRDEPGSSQVRELLDTCGPHGKILVSHLTLLECYSVLMAYLRAERNKKLKKKLREIVERLTKDIKSAKLFHRLRLSESEAIFYRAESLILTHAGKFSFGSHDALHLAIASLLPTPPVFVTSDKPVKNICASISLAFYDPQEIPA
jgi:predicted nucleic acid-binding protein